MIDLIAEWLYVLDSCEVTAPDLRILKANPKFSRCFDALTGGNADEILDRAVENAERKRYGAKRQRTRKKPKTWALPHP